jgi:hypothetical protein
VEGVQARAALSLARRGEESAGLVEGDAPARRFFVVTTMVRLHIHARTVSV